MSERPTTQSDAVERELRIAKADLAKTRHDLDLIRNSRFWALRNRIAALLGRKAPTTPADAGPPSVSLKGPEHSILVIDTHVPQPDRESGAVRLMGLIGIIQSLGYSVIFVPEDGRLPEPYTSEMRALGITIIGSMSAGVYATDALSPLLPKVAVAWVCRPGPCRTYFPRLLRHRHIKLIYDTIDLHYVRLQRQANLLSSSTRSQSPLDTPLPLGEGPGVRDESGPLAPNPGGTGLEATGDGWRAIKELEIAMAGIADRVVLVTDTERAVLETEGVRNVSVVPNVHTTYDGPIPGFDKRSGLLFIGGFRHEPNVDAVLWFCNEVLPIIHKSDPDMHVTLLGSDPPASVRRFHGSFIDVPGYLKDVTQYFLDARVFICPLRYGAGMKGKLGQAFSYGLPAVSTSIGVEGMRLTDGGDVLTADTAESFAAATMRLNADADLWQRLSAGGLAKVETYSAGNLRPVIETLLSELRATADNL